METRLKAMEQQVFKCHEMVEHGLDANHIMITEFTNNHKLDAKNIGETIFKLHEKIKHLQAQSMTCKTKTVSMNIDSRG